MITRQQITKLTGFYKVKQITTRVERRKDKELSHIRLDYYTKMSATEF